MLVGAVASGNRYKPRTTRTARAAACSLAHTASRTVSTTLLPTHFYTLVSRHVAHAVFCALVSYLQPTVYCPWHLERAYARVVLTLAVALRRSA